MAVLRSRQNFHDYHVTDLVSYNLQEWLSYGLLELGAYTVVAFDLPTSGYTVLQRTYDNNYGGAGRVYEGLGSWAWQSGVQVPDGYDPIFQVSGVYVDGVFYDKDTVGQYAHTIDYRNGRIIFDNEIINEETVVQAEYVFHDVAIYNSDNVEWQTILDTYQEAFESISELQPSGVAAVLKERRVWLPCVVLNVQDRTHRPFQLGGGEIAQCGVFWHVLGETPAAHNSLKDIINDQVYKTIRLFDVNEAPFPLNSVGELQDNLIEYPELASPSGDYFWSYGYFANSYCRDKDNKFGLYYSEVRQQLDIQRHVF